MTELQIPTKLLPIDGRFGGGPSKIRPEALKQVATSPIMGTSHRQSPAKDLVGRVKSMLCEVYAAPDGYEVALGVGGASLFWDAAIFSLIEQKSAHGVFGAFGKKFYVAAQNAPFLGEPVLAEAEPGELAIPGFSDVEIGDADVVCWPQNETSTGVAAPVIRPDTNALVLIDATSSSGGMDVDLSQTDAYYFSPQKNWSSDGGLWLSFLSPAAIERLEKISESGRWIPNLLNLQKALANSRKNQTLNTPALATLLLLAEQLEWLLENGGIQFAVQRTTSATDHVYQWAEASHYATPFVKDPTLRSPMVATIEFDPEIDLEKVKTVLRSNGIVDIGSYRGVGENQLRICAYASVELDDVSRLTACIDWVINHLN